MNERERFRAMVRFETPDHVPIFGFPGAPGMSRGCMRGTWDRLVATGMPAGVGSHDLDDGERVESWKRYWGTADPMTLDFRLERDVPGFRTTSHVEGEYEIIESESGAVRRQVLDNEATYSMPEFITYPVRDRESWEFYRKRQTPRGRMPADEMEERCRAYDDRDRPLVISAGGTVGSVRSLMGPEAACTALYDDPELVRDIMQWKLDMTREYVFPLIERLRPEVVALWEDICGNHAMMVSPRQFEEFGGDYYRETCAAARANGADLVTVDSDGNVGELVPLLASFGVNGLYPFEAKGNADLISLRRELPEFVMFGWLEKETVNEGNEDRIEEEIMSKVPPMLERGGYFPNGDHGIQPLATFDGMRRFMTILHEVCGNPEGTFPRTE